MFHYRAVAASGEAVEGQMEAPDRSAVARTLYEHAYTPIRIADRPIAPPGAAARALAWLLAPLGRGRALAREAGRLPEVLAALLHAGVPLDEGLAILGDAAERPEAALLYRRLRERVRAGRPLSAALTAEGALFDGFAVAITQAGEAGGRLDAALMALAGYRRRAAQLADSIKSALVYPAVLLGFGAVSVLAMMAFVIPEFERLFQESGRELPLFTRMVFGLAGFLRDWAWLILALGLGLAWWSARRLGDPARRQRFDRARLRWPIYGRLRLLFDSERLMRALSAALAHGIDLPGALTLASRTIGNRHLRAGIAEAAQKVRQGQPVAPAIAEAGPWPPALARMVRVGVETGRLADLCGEAAEIFGRDAEASAKRLVTLLEPALIIGIGLIVGAIITAVLTAIVGLNALAL